jgi:hypothetical protein
MYKLSVLETESRTLHLLGKQYIIWTESFIEQKFLKFMNVFSKFYILELDIYNILSTSIFIEGAKDEWKFLFSVWISNCFCIIYWKDHPFCTEFSFNLCWKSVVHICVCLFLDDSGFSSADLLVYLYSEITLSSYGSITVIQNQVVLIQSWFSFSTLIFFCKDILAIWGLFCISI